MAGLRSTALALCSVSALLASALVAPAVSAADQYCVAEPVCASVVSNHNEGSGAAGLEKALTSATKHVNSGGADVVVIGPGTYSKAGGFGYTYSEAVEIRGAGAGSTILTIPVEAGTVFDLTSAASKMSGLSIALTAGAGETGLVLNGGTAEGVSVTGGGGLDAPSGLHIVSGVFASGSIAMSEATVSKGVEATGGEVRETSVTALDPVEASKSLTLRRDVLSGVNAVIESYFTNLTVEDSLINLRGGTGPGIVVAANSNGTASATLRQLTIVDGGSSSRGLQMEGNEANATAELNDSIISGVKEPIAQFASGVGKKTVVKSAYSSYQASKDVGKAGEEVIAAHLLAATTEFVEPVTGFDSPGAGNWRLLPTSALIDAGSPGALAGNELSTDLAGNPRLINATRDVGAYEYQRQAPAVSAEATPAAAQVGAAMSFTGAALEPEPGDTVAEYQWSFDDGAVVPAGATATHAFSTAGIHTATLTATDVIGVSSTKAITVTVTPAAAGGGAGGGTPGGSHPAPAPASISLAISPASFKASRTGSSIAHGHAGMKVSYTLPAPGSVKFTVERLSAGVISGHACVAAPHRHHAGTKPCVRATAVHGSLTRAGKAGANAFRFSGRLSGKTLSAGNYLLVAQYLGAVKASAQVKFRVAR